VKKSDKKILLIGPKTETLDAGLFDDYATIVFSQAIVHLLEKGMRPDYWAFIDPTAFFMARTKMIKKNLALDSNTKLLLADIYTKYQEFAPGRYAFGSDQLADSFTTRSNMYEFSQLYPRYNYELLDSDIVNVNIGQKHLDNVDFSRNMIIFRHGVTPNAHNTDKFSCFLLPMVLHAFKNVKEILCLGFGEFDRPNPAHPETGFRGYEEYKRSFDTVMPLIKREIDKRAIKISFVEGDKSYYNKLSE